jgi:hypothetical protein
METHTNGIVSLEGGWVLSDGGSVYGGHVSEGRVTVVVLVVVVAMRGKNKTSRATLSLFRGWTPEPSGKDEQGGGLEA